MTKIHSKLRKIKSVALRKYSMSVVCERYSQNIDITQVKLHKSHFGHTMKDVLGREKKPMDCKTPSIWTDTPHYIEVKIVALVGNSTQGTLQSAVYLVKT